MTDLADPRNAVLVFRQEAFSLGKDKIEGRQAAGASFLEGFVRYSGRDNFYVCSPSVDESKQFAGTVETYHPAGAKRIVHVPFAAVNRASEPGALHRPDPLIGEQAWWRQRTGHKGFSITGVAHTTASQQVMHGLIDVINGPTQSWDAVICPSQSVRSMITTVLDAQADYLKGRFGGKPRCPVQLPVIPLGVNPGDFEPTKQRRDKAKAYREKIGAGPKDIVVLFVGRLTHNQKMNPAPTYMALEEAARRTKRKIHMVWCGWFTSDKNKALFTKGAKDLAPSISVHHVDGRSPQAREHIWHAADIFMALVDNIQETFGLVPLEAMAAGVPVIVSDWNGYRETVQHGIHGYRVPTAMPPPGSGTRAAWRYECYSLGYQDYLQATTQTIHMDLGAAADALESLITNRDLRRRMGKAARAYVSTNYDWKKIIPQYQDLWEELAGRRAKDKVIGKGNVVPRSLDPHTLFEAYPSRTLREGDKLGWGTWPNVPRDLMDFPSALGVPDTTLNLKDAATMSELMDQTGIETEDRWLHPSRVLRWAGRFKKPKKL